MNTLSHTHTQIALMMLVDWVDRMEDPFDDTVLDTLSVLESVMHVAAVSFSFRPVFTQKGFLQDSRTHTHTYTHTLSLSLSHTCTRTQMAKPASLEDDTWGAEELVATKAGVGGVGGGGGSKPGAVQLSAAAGLNSPAGAQAGGREVVRASTAADDHVDFIPPPMPPMAGSGGYGAMIG
jgi:hypothetical protein